ncbi:hypothetical protein Aab01nite_11140 [Paractinoplanes abujensis]|uniref:Uncharacterized protein n=1 Tax=Paractinoplanes abujensis TaxID=882441 RepID=A0A7W7CM30_9ACTN|nr:DUF6069 family protein [Actinoplanes abujensis]MBB4691064.1 hypothetical protein [Actinoplanes abujensis]GID17524.1 hypothetical protein Aab01nite_11140 [Actinoplanes abujensis]
MRRVIVAVVGAVTATAAGAALAGAAGIDFEVVDGEAIPVAGFAVVTAVCCLAGVVMAVAFRRWSTRPRERFVWTAAGLTAVSLVLPLISGAEARTVAALIGLHLIPAAVMIPALARSLPPRDRSEVA